MLAVKQGDYRIVRDGAVYRAIDRYGQQADGTWVFADVQYAPDGSLTLE